LEHSAKALRQVSQTEPVSEACHGPKPPGFGGGRKELGY
jgi:hypothetical protein